MKEDIVVPSTENERVDDEHGGQPGSVEHEKTNERRYPTRENRGVPPDYLQYASCCIDFCYAMNAVPTTYEEAINGEHADEWKNAMDSEIESLRKNDTFIEADVPPKRKVLGGKWVYKVKSNQGQPLFKARYVTQGFGKVKNIDFHETFSPTPRMESLGKLIQVAVQNGYLLHQMDVRTAY